MDRAVYDSVINIIKAMIFGMQFVISTGTTPPLQYYQQLGDISSRGLVTTQWRVIKAENHRLDGKKFRFGQLLGTEI